MELGPMGNFIYFLGDEQTKEISVIDPGWEANFLSEEAKRLGYTIKAIFLTHGHYDHVNALEALLALHDVPVYISKYEPDIYTPKVKNVIKVENNEKLKIGNIEFTCIHTPGHTPGGQCFQHKNILLTGDMLFIDGCGRCDLPGGDAAVMHDTLYNFFINLPDDTVLYTGHNYGSVPYTTIAEQKKTNPFLNCPNKEEFLLNRM